MLTYTVLNDIVYFPVSQETFVPVEVREDDNVIRTELWTLEKVRDLEDQATNYKTFLR